MLETWEDVQVKVRRESFGYVAGSSSWMEDHFDSPQIGTGRYSVRRRGELVSQNGPPIALQTLFPGIRIVRACDEAAHTLLVRNNQNELRFKDRVRSRIDGAHQSFVSVEM